MPETNDTKPEKVSLEIEARPVDNIAGNENNTDDTADDKPPDPPKRDFSLEKSDDQYASVSKPKTWGSFNKRRFVYKRDISRSRMSCLRISLIVFNLFIWTLGAVITALGIWIESDGDLGKIQSNLNVSQFNTAGWILIFVGIVIMLIGFVGCYGAIMSQICCLIVFSIIVCILIVMEVVVIALVWTTVASKNTQEEVKLKAKQAMIDMSKDKTKAEFIHLVQAKLQCCGVDGPGDYAIYPDNQVPVPNSCSDKDTGGYFQRGCYHVILDYLKGKAAVVGGVGVAVFLLQVGVVVFAICMICGLWHSGNSFA